MKRLVTFVLSLTLLLVLVGCQGNQTQGSKTNSNVLKAWSGEFSEDKLKSAINEYQKNYTNIILEDGSTSSVSFETDFEVSSCWVSHLSPADDMNIEIELNSYIDLVIETKCEGKTVTIPIDWLYKDDDSGVNDPLIWSYLVGVKDANGSSHYYYFRVDYSAYVQ